VFPPQIHHTCKESGVLNFSPVIQLACISQCAVKGADPGMSTALRSVGRLDVPSSTPAAPSGRAPCFHARLRRPATKAGEKSGPNNCRIGLRPCDFRRRPEVGCRSSRESA